LKYNGDFRVNRLPLFRHFFVFGRGYGIAFDEEQNFCLQVVYFKQDPGKGKFGEKDTK
jgi:hypothetical protein